MQIEYVNPKNLKPYELNSKLHPEAQIKALAKEISEVGFHSPIVISHDNVIVAGHGRTLASLDLGLEQVPVYRLPADISPERVRAIRLFDNKISESGYDDALLKQELSELALVDGFDFTATGYADVAFASDTTSPLPGPIEPETNTKKTLMLKVYTETEEQLVELRTELEARGLKITSP